MTTEELALVVSEAFSMMKAGSTGPGPGPLQRRLTVSAELFGLQLGEADFQQVLDWLLSEDVGVAARRTFETMLHLWDHSNAIWAVNTAPNTLDRRARINELLDFKPAHREIVDRLYPPRLDQQEPVLIVDEAKDWYTPTREAEQRFYWQAYTRSLQALTWPASSIERLDTASRNVVANFADPTQEEICQTKGLVVGYVQSGKTANFTAVIAKAVDAGYRLIIVLAGTLDILRRQTQKRIDRELLGKEAVKLNVPGGEFHDYVSDDDWDKFLEHGGRPSELGAFDWHRLTGSALDYQSLGRGLPSLEFERKYSDRRINDRENLRGMTARLVVVKKHPAVLRKLLNDLTGLVKTSLMEIPALIIDDESDQASINTRKLTKKELKTRTETNRGIVDLLGALKRAQYVGYTATPFANVFIDPEDAKDLFPKDYIETLPRPEGYMGVADFFDLDEDPPAGYESNERAYVRDIRGDDSEAFNLPRALDCFAIAGAIKLHRMGAGPRWRFRHHTMLVHRSHRMKAHEDDAEVVRQAWRRASFLKPLGASRLRTLYESDFLPVTACKAEVGTPDLPSFEELLPFVNQCLERVGDEPVLIVNGEHQDDTPDFDRAEVWKIIVGGTKLSRGYTIEGLTVSYYRRPTAAADTLMQMGRWFGFRPGYRDLVRLFIGRAEVVARPKKGQPKTIDLYEAFGAICRDEEEFRGRLAYLSKEHEPRIRPRQVPPLVPSHLLPPTSKNKMFNAQLVSENFGGKRVERTGAPTSARGKRANESLTRRLIERMHLWRETTGVPGQRNTEYIIGVVRADLMLRFLEAYEWSSRPEAFAPVLEFCRGTNGDPEIKQWLFLAPQTIEATIMGTWRAKQTEFKVVGRSRESLFPERFKAYSDKEHRQFASRLIENGGAGLTCSERLIEAVQPCTSAFLFYPCREAENVVEVSMGFELQFPPNNLPKRVYFSVRKDVDDVVVSVK